MTKRTREWFTEPHRVEFEAFGLPCLVLRHPWSGHLCGYVGVPASHPWQGKGYNDPQQMPEGWLESAEGTVDELGVMNIFCASVKEIATSPSICLLVRCHQGLTFAGAPCWPDETRSSWWFGFDCAHSEDLCPSDEEWGRKHGAVYRNMEYVRTQCALAAEDIAKFSTPAESPRP